MGKSLSIPEPVFLFAGKGICQFAPSVIEVQHQFPRTGKSIILQLETGRERSSKGRGYVHWASLGAQMVKHLSEMQETRVRSLGQEGPLEKEMAIHSSILAWRIPWTEEPGGLHGVVKSQIPLSD